MTLCGHVRMSGDVLLIKVVAGILTCVFLVSTSFIEYGSTICSCLTSNDSFGCSDASRLALGSDSGHILNGLIHVGG